MAYLDNFRDPHITSIDKRNQGSSTHYLYAYENFENENNLDESQDFKPSSLDAEANDEEGYAYF